MLEWRGEIYVWAGNRWQRRDADSLRLEIWRALAHVAQTRDNDDGSVTRTSPKADNQLVSNVFQALRAQTQLKAASEPAWLRDSQNRPNPRGCWAFEDVLIDIWATAEGFKKNGEYNWEIMPRDASFFSTVTLPCDFDDEAKAPVWERCLGEWGSQDPEWSETRERFYGYAAWGERVYDKWMMEFGRARGGKGTGARFLSKMLGYPAYFGTSMANLSTQFGMDGLQGARVMMIEEAEDLDRGAGSRVATIIKQLVGGGVTTIDKKGIAQQRLELKVVPMLQSNILITLPDDKKGLSSKMIALQFDHSFAKVADPHLDEKLLAEAPGILLRWMKALVRLVAEEDIEAKFPMPAASREVLRRFELADNPWESFLDERCIEDTDALISLSRLVTVMRTWEKDSGIEFTKKRGKPVADRFLVAMLLDNTEWKLARARLGAGGEDGRHLRGLLVKKL